MKTITSVPDFNQPGQAVILAGGLGTRLRPITDTIPKPMIRFHGKPFLEYLVEMLKEEGFSHIVMLLGYLPEVITDYFGTGERFGIKITYSITPVEDDTGARLKKAQHLLDHTFLMLYCDNYCPLNFKKMWAQFIQKDVDVQLTSYNNLDSYTKSNLYVDENSYVSVYDKSRKASNLNGVDIGYAFIKKKIIEDLPEENINFERHVYPALTLAGKLAAFRTSHRYYSVGDFRRLQLTDNFFKRTPTIILDRDGVINVKAPKACYVTKPSEFVWKEGSREAIKILKKRGYRILVITNQAGISRGLMTEKDLEEIHASMRNQLMDDGEFKIYIDAIYHCPHGWDDGCECRKPKPGMLFAAQKDYDLDLKRVFFIGDDIRDKEAGDEADCKTILVTEVDSLLDIIHKRL